MRIVQPHELAILWPQVEPWISAAIAEGQGDENATDVLVALARGLYMLWIEPDKFAAVVQLSVFPRQRVATVLYLGGSDLDAMKRLLREEGIPWARAQGIDVLRVWGRAGWERVLGLERKGVILQADLRGTLQ